MKRWIGVVIVVAALGGGACWIYQREAARGRSRAQQEQQQGGERDDARRQGGGAAPRAGRGGAAGGGSTMAGLGPRGQAPDERHPRHLSAQQLRSNPGRAAIRRDELIKQIRKVGQDPGGEDQGDRNKAVLGKEQIQTAIKTVTPLVKRCYEERLAKKKDLQGKVVVKFTIVAKDGEGSLDAGEIKSSTLGDLRLDTCMLHALTKARFPLPEGEGKVTVNYPFTFKPTTK